MRSFKRNDVRHFLGTALLAASTLLAGCFQTDERKAGVDDFPNSIYARVNGFMAESKKADSLQTTAAADSLLMVTAALPIPHAKRGALPQGLAKLSAGPADSCAGIIEWDSSGTDPFGAFKVDSATVCVDSAFPRHIIRFKSVRTFPGGRVESSEASDADGDGLVNAMPGLGSKVRLVITVVDTGVTEQTTLVMGGGPDDDFDTEPDNLTYSAEWSKRRGNDTLGSASYADADGDGVAIDNGKPSTVRATLYQKGATADDPDALWSRLTLEMTVRYKVEAKEIRAFKAESESRDGRLNTAVLLNRQGGERIDSHDTVEAHFTQVGTAAKDTLDTAKTVLTMNVGADFDSKGDDSIFAIHVVSKKKLGEEKLAVFDFVSDKPIPSGHDAESGDLTMRVEYADGSALAAMGKFTAATVEVTAEMRDGKRVHAVWDRQGKGISLEHLN